jgi:uncharacterized membrane protein
MNGGQLHLALNHLPVAGAIFGAGMLVLGMVARSETLRRGALAVLALAALSGPAAFLSGEPAEEVAERIPGISETMIEEHEEAASIALGAVAIAGAVAVAGLIFIRRRGAAPKGLYPLVLVLALAAAAILGRAAHLGGLIRHPEIGAVPAGR